MIEQHCLEVGLKSRRHEAPHILVAAESMRKDHRTLAIAPDLNMISIDDGHLALFPLIACSACLGLRKDRPGDGFDGRDMIFQKATALPFATCLSPSLSAV
ncbi:hypothetical protein [Rhizobium leguminosarum]|uniref:hypothetical protein n=1 Tax=Rhizobium leguminosarum TaxID=384 RepID=UPI0021BC2786|nr:hypothetical protein [Rhizobium leguminosarum]